MEVIGNKSLIRVNMVCSHCILIPQGSTGNSTFWCQMKAPYFLIITQKFQLQIHYTLQVIAENVAISDIPILILCIFITASSPMSHIFAPKEKIKSYLEVKLCKMCLRVKINQFRMENTHVKMGTTLFKIVYVKGKIQ